MEGYMKSILVTGATGFLGRTVVDRLLVEGYRLRCTVRDVKRAEHLVRRGVEIVVGDLADASFAQRASVEVDVIVHAAALLGGWGGKESFVRNNLEATRNLLEGAMRSCVRQFVFVSSATSYGRTTDRRITEDTSTRVESDPYCETKLECEELVRSYSARSGMKATILRPVIIYGAYDLRFLPRVIEHMRRGTMLAVGRVNQGPPLVYSKDVAAFITASLLHQNSPFEIFNLCSPESVSWERIVREVGVALELPTQVSRIPLSIAFAAGGLLEFIWKLFRAKSPPILTRFLVGMIGLNYDFDASKALLVAGFPGFTPFSAGLKETLDWFCRRERHLNLIPRGLDDGKCGHEYLAAHEAAL